MPYLDNHGPWHMAIVSDNKYYMTLTNDKFIWLDVFAPDSLDVIYRLIRLNIAKMLKEQHNFIQRRLDIKNRKAYIAWYRTNGRR